MRWSNPIPLSEYSEAPNEKGIYQIGFGKDDFSAKYLGRAKGMHTSIRTRLSSHYNLRGNKHINERNRDGLYARWIRASDPACSEANLLQQNDYPWNEKVENCDSD